MPRGNFTDDGLSLEELDRIHGGTVDNDLEVDDVPSERTQGHKITTKIPIEIKHTN